jgi:hypothetical protein
MFQVYVLRTPSYTEKGSPDILIETFEAETKKQALTLKKEAIAKYKMERYGRTYYNGRLELHQNF